MLHLALLALLFQAPRLRAEEQEPAESGPEIQQREATPEDLADYEAALARFQERMEEFQEDSKRYLALKEQQQRAEITDSYNRLIKGLVEEEDSLRTLAKARFEAFLQKYPDAPYSAHVMFRLADLEFEEAENQWLEATKEYDRMVAEAPPDAELPPPPLKDYTGPIALYERIIEHFPDYERIDGVYYMLGYCYSEENSAQKDKQKGLAALEKLVTDFPDSEFANDANMRIGEYYFEENQTEKAIPYYERIVAGGEKARYYDKGLYKLAWSHYKLANIERFEEYEKALDLFMQLLDYSRKRLLETGERSPMEPEAVKYMAISFADVSDVLQKSPVEVADEFFARMGGDKPYAIDIYKQLAEVLVQQARWEDAIAAYRTIQERWPLDPENPQFQYRIALLYNNLPVPDKAASARANLELAKRYNDSSEWWQANRDNPEALAIARGYIEQSLAQVAIDLHRKAQESHDPADYSKAADKYREYLQKFPFVDGYYEMEWYLADALLNAHRLEEAEHEYLQLLKTENPYHDGSLWRLLQVRRQMLVDRFGRIEARGPDAVVERTYTTPYGATITVYRLDDAHKAFIETADEVVQHPFKDPQFEKAREEDLAALTYLPGQILYEFGHLEEARERLFKVIELYPKHDEAAYAAGLIVRSYQDENDLQKVRLYTGQYARMALGSSEEAVAKAEEFASIEEGAAFKLAYGLIEKGDREAAAEAFLQFMKDFPDSEHRKDALFNAANSLEIIGKADRANALFEQYINEYPTDERSRGLYFRIASNYASILELDKAIHYYKQLVANFPDAADAPAALFNAAFLQIGIGDHRGAAQDFEAYATRYPDQPDAEVAYFKAGEQWEKVGPAEALSFYRRYLRRYPDANPEHAMQAQYRIIHLLEDMGKKRQAEKEWDTLVEMARAFAEAGRLGPLGRRYAAEADFRHIWDHFQSFQQIHFTGRQEKDAPMLVQEKPADLKQLESECLALIQRYHDFVYSSAATYVQAAAYFAYADMLFQAPPPKGFTQEQIDIYTQKLDELRIPVEEKGKARALAVLEMAKQEHGWSEWQGRTLDLLNARFPSEFPKERPEARLSTDGWSLPEPGPLGIEIEEPGDEEAGGEPAPASGQPGQGAGQPEQGGQGAWEGGQGGER